MSTGYATGTGIARWATMPRTERRGDVSVARSPVRAERLYAFVDWIAKRLRVEVIGIERLPVGRALLVANHAFGWDVLFAMSAIRGRTGRPVWALGDHVWWKIPGARRIAAELGTVDGTQANADALLSRDELVLVLPGGIRVALKPRELRYRLVWGNRYGFVRAAIRNQAPIVPVASIGADEFFDLIGNAFARGSRWLRGSGIPIPRPAHLLPIPHFVRMNFIIGEPIPPPGPADGPDEALAVRRLRREVEGALHEMFEHELANRIGLPFSSAEPACGEQSDPKSIERTYSTKETP
jgi:1-acyl-sn-glycerol-3-phosphate acyltransferase